MTLNTKSSKLKTAGLTAKFQAIALVDPKDLKAFQSPAFQAKLLRETRKKGLTKYNNSRMFRKILEKMLKEPAEVLTFFNYEID